MNGSFRGPQACEITGVSYRQLDYWARTDLVRPSITDAHGSGTQRRYSYSDLVVLAAIRAVLDAGVSLHSARQFVERLRAGEAHAERTVVVARVGPVVTELDFAELRRDLDEAIADVESERRVS